MGKQKKKKYNSKEQRSCVSMQNWSTVNGGPQHNNTIADHDSYNTLSTVNICGKKKEKQNIIKNQKPK